MADHADDIKITTTGDGSTTLYSGRFSQHYHNPNGAVAESRHVFFEKAEVPDALTCSEEINFFETGFGTGLNLILTKDYLEYAGSSCRVQFFSVEAFPVTPVVAKKLDFGPELEKHNPNALLGNIFGSLIPGWNRFEITELLTLHLWNGPFSEMPLPERTIHFFFHDPFSPEVNRELWTPEVFQTLLAMAAGDAVLATYCAATSARAAMAVAGWKTARAPGALGKREMTIASNSESKLVGFKLLNNRRLIERYKRGDFD
jgi:tRNA U34 5-methylaminomethyl-2-thiouridine-forming methyltransferase MnmC